jgi:glucan phosphoethanolaminetransferase (alkaline phosphatase superfamily)
METLIKAFDRVIEMLYFDYIFATILIIYLLIKYVLPNSIREGRMVLFSVGIALCSATAFYFLGDYKKVNLILSLLTLVTFYEWIVKRIFHALGIQYQSSDPELIKPKKEDKP